MQQIVIAENLHNIIAQDPRDEAYSRIGDTSIKWLRDQEGSTLVTGPREYQRERVASLSWKQNIIHTILCNGFAQIPQLHIRVMKLGSTDDGTPILHYELVDGQQRVTSVLDFLSGKFSLPNNFITTDGIDISGMFISDIRGQYPHIEHRILDYRVSTIFYENLDDLQVSQLFVEVLNNTNNLNPQEIRNALRGPYSEWIRNTARFEDTHDLFERVIVNAGTRKEKAVLKHFSSKFPLRGRMEVDEFLSELVYLHINGVEKGISQDKHTSWVKVEQSSQGKFGSVTKFNAEKKKLEDLLKFSLNLIKSVKDTQREKLSPMVSMMMILYARRLQDRYGKIHVEAFTKKFFDVYDRWSDKKAKLYMPYQQPNGKQMQPFKDLFGGKNANAIKSIFMILDMELAKDPESFGVVQLDPRESFSRADILRKYEEQGGRCPYTGEELDINNIVGDHRIPRAWGVAKGGVTEYDNLVVTSPEINRRKSDKSEEEFLRILNG